MDPRDGEFVVASQEAPIRLLAALRAFRPQVSWSNLRSLLERGFVSVDGAVARAEGMLLQAGSVLRIRVGQRAAPPVVKTPALEFAHVDRDLVVVHKPAGVPTVPFAGESEPTLDRLVAAQLGRGIVHVVQRLDRDTSGLLVFARNPEAERGLAQQLRFHTMHRRYLALVHGAATAKTIESWLADDRGDGLRGSVRDARLGKHAVTHVTVVERLRGATLVACRLETGRTHQIRIHMAEDGHMVLGERGYTRDHEGPVLPAPRICLHAAELGFAHPRDGAPLRFSAPLPPDLADLVVALRPDPGRSRELPAGGGRPT